MKVLDLCSGTGSATQAFKDLGHEVITVDIEEGADIICDVRNFEPSGYFDFIWCSPPCTEFSIAKRIPYQDRNPDMSVVNACVRVIKEINPEYWIMENPRGMLRHLIGKPTITVQYADYGYPVVKPTDLWGYFPFFYSRVPRTNPTIPWDTAFPHKSRAWKERAHVPYELSRSVCLALEGVINA